MGAVRKYPNYKAYENKGNRDSVELSSKKTKEKTFEINSFISTNKKINNDFEELLKYDEFLMEEKKRLNEKQKLIEQEHRTLVQEKYKPLGNSSPNSIDSKEIEYQHRKNTCFHRRKFLKKIFIVKIQ